MAGGRQTNLVPLECCRKSIDDPVFDSVRNIQGRLIPLGKYLVGRYLEFLSIRSERIDGFVDLFSYLII